MRQKIFEENKRDLAAAEEDHIAQAVMKRLKFDEGKLRDVIKGIEQLVALPDPLGKVTLKRQLDEGISSESCHLSDWCYRSYF